ncbi:MAG: acyltransferase family protein [Sphingobium sp.]
MPALALPAKPNGSTGAVPSSSGRMQWMDLLRGFCMLTVIIMHATPAIRLKTSLESPEAIQLLNLAFSPYRMPTLMFLSGMLLGRSLKKPLRPYVEGKFYQIFWPFLIFSLVVLAAENRMTLSFIAKIPISSPTLFWYLWFLFAYYIIGFAMHKARMNFAIIALLSLVASIFLPETLRISRFAYLFSFFAMGHYFMSCPGSILRWQPLAWIGLVASLVGSWISMRGIEIRYTAAYVWAPFGFILVATWVMPLFRHDSRILHFVEWIGRNSIVFYTVHFPVQCLTAALMWQLGKWDYMTIYLTTLAVSILASVAMQLLRERFLFFAGLYDFSKMKSLGGSLHALRPFSR